MNLPVILLAHLCAIFLSMQTSSAFHQFSELSENALREMLLTSDGQNINAEAMLQLAEKLIIFNRVVNHHTAKAGKITTNPTSPALDAYLTIGSQPATTHIQGLSVACDVCASMIHVLGPVITLDKVYPVVLNILKLLCPIVTGYQKEVCTGYIDNLGPIFHYILPNLLKSPYSLCGKLLGARSCGTPDHPQQLWSVPIPDRLPNPIPRSVNRNTESSKTKLTVLYMADFQIDQEYAPGSIAKCNAPLCCRNSSTSADEEYFDDSHRAGFWGDYRGCDLPLWTLDDMLRHINSSHGGEIDIIMFGGDLIPQDTWLSKPEENSKFMETFADMLTKYLPGTPFYLALGNHETSPVASFPLPQDQPEFSNQWLYDKAAEVWSKWLNESTIETIKKGGFYTTLIRPGWRLITLNSNICYRYDWFLWAPHDVSDPFDELKWMISVLEEAEKKGEVVVILSHIQPGTKTCIQAWSWNYYRIIDRFADIIVAQFYGHEHNDFFVMNYDAETLTQPKTVSFVGPPGTPYYHNNIGYRLYEFDPSTYILLNYRQYYGDIKAANENGKMEWKFEYSAKEEYALPDMSAQSWADLLTRMQTNSTLVDLYQKHYFLSLSYELEPCGSGCRRNRLCESYGGLSQTGEEWCEHFFPSKTAEEDAETRKCSARFLRKLTDAD